LAHAVRQLFAGHLDRSATRRYAEQFSWEATRAGQMELFHRIISAPAECSGTRTAGTG
jgi:hypothetical protein